MAASPLCLNLISRNTNSFTLLKHKQFHFLHFFIVVFFNWTHVPQFMLRSSRYTVRPKFGLLIFCFESFSLNFLSFRRPFNLTTGFLAGLDWYWNFYWIFQQPCSIARPVTCYQFVMRMAKDTCVAPTDVGGILYSCDIVVNQH